MGERRAALGIVELPEGWRWNECEMSIGRWGVNGDASSAEAGARSTPSVPEAWLGS